MCVGCVRRRTMSCQAHALPFANEAARRESHARRRRRAADSQPRGVQVCCIRSRSPAPQSVLRNGSPREVRRCKPVTQGHGSQGAPRDLALWLRRVWRCCVKRAGCTHGGAVGCWSPRGCSACYGRAMGRACAQRCGRTLGPAAAPRALNFRPALRCCLAVLPPARPRAGACALCALLLRLSGCLR